MMIDIDDLDSIFRNANHKKQIQIPSVWSLAGLKGGNCK